LGFFRQLQHEGRLRTMDILVMDFRLALRRLAATPVFAILAVLIIAIGIGANTVIFSTVNAALFRPQPFERPDQLVHVYQGSDDGAPTSSSFPAYRRIAESTTIFAEAAAFYPTSAGLETDAGIRQASVEYATSSYLSLLGLHPFRGRWFTSEEDHTGAGGQAVVGYWTWMNRFGGDPNILGRTFRLNGAIVTVAGVGPQSFNGAIAGTAVDFWLSLSSLSSVAGPYAGRTLDEPGDHWFLVKARLQEGVTVAQAQQAMNALSTELERQFAGRDEKRSIFVYPLDQVRIHPEIDGALAPAATALLSVVGLLLALACSNIAVLLLIRGSVRARDVSIRLAIGATRQRIMREFLAESVLLSTGGGVLGYAGAWWAIRGIAHLQLPMSIPQNFDIAPDYRVAFFAFSLSLITGIAFGLAPALRASQMDVLSTLRDGGFATGRRRFGLKNALVMLQVALSAVLLVGTGLLLHSLINSQNAAVGFDIDSVAVLETNAGYAGYSVEQSRTRFDELEARIAALPGTEAVTRAVQTPVSRRGTSTLTIDETVLPTGTEGIEVPFATVGSNFFEALRIPIVYGRGFEPSDAADGPSVAIVSETAARTYWGTANAVGKRFRSYGSAGSWTQVVGVAKDVKVRSLVENPTPLIYRPWNPRAATAISYLVRTRGNTEAMAGTLHRTLREFDPALPVLQARSFADHLGEQLFMPRLASLFLAGFSTVGLLLAAVGLYAVVSFSVTERATEVGIRMALGAKSIQVVGMIIQQMMLTVSCGLAIGFGLALLVGRSLSRMLYRVPAIDPVTFVGVAFVLSIVAFGAVSLPARRAATKDPMTTLRIR
jgi:predicted permease